MSGESFAQQIDTVRQRPMVFPQLAEQASQKTLTQDFHELFTEIEELRAAASLRWQWPFQILGSVLLLRIWPQLRLSIQKKKDMGFGLIVCKRINDISRRYR